MRWMLTFSCGADPIQWIQTTRASAASGISVRIMESVIGRAGLRLRTAVRIATEDATGLESGRLRYSKWDGRGWDGMICDGCAVGAELRFRNRTE